jgi:parallel beta helix pectate lyase-like protein
MNDSMSCRVLPSRRPLARVLRVSAGALVPLVLGLVALPATAGAAVLPANPSTFGAAFSAAQGGDVVELASGDYGKFTGANKPGTVTVRAAAGAAPTMSVAFSNASNIRVEGVTMQGADVGGSSKNITIAGSNFTSSATIQASSMSNANIVFDGDTFAGIDVCGNCYEGRLQIAGQGPGPSGVTIQNSVFGPGGNADGIQDGANGVQILGNTFVGIRQTTAVHSDALQLYGQRNTTIRGNYFHDNDVSIMAPDGGDHEVITDNVFVGTDYRPAVQLGSQNGTTFQHNTVKSIDVFMDKKSESPTPSSNGVIRDNLMVNGSIHVASSTCTGCDDSFNLFSSSGNSSGANALIGMPAFVGGANPTTYAGYQLAAGSPGKAAASDGADRGARFVLPTTPTPAPGRQEGAWPEREARDGAPAHVGAAAPRRARARHRQGARAGHAGAPAQRREAIDGEHDAQDPARRYADLSRQAQARADGPPARADRHAARHRHQRRRGQDGADLEDPHRALVLH